MEFCALEIPYLMIMYQNLLLNLKRWMSKNRRNVRKTVSKGENIKKVVAMKNYG